MSKPVKRVDRDGNVCWRLNGQLHRTDGPAVEYYNGTRCWYVNGQRHRTDGPAVESANGDREWYLNGKKIEMNDTISSFIENGLISLRDYLKKKLTYQ